MRRFAAVLALLVGILVVSTGTASALPVAPGQLPAVPGQAPPIQNPPNGGGLFDCKTAPDPQAPGEGFSGAVDPTPNNGPGIYRTYGYPPAYNTYDLGCSANPLNAPKEVSGNLDTTLSNYVTGAATAVIATTNGLHRLVTPPTFLHSLDPLVERATAAVSASVYGPWLATSLVLLGVGIIFAARKRNLPGAANAVGWMLLVITLAAFAIAFPLRAGDAADAQITSVVQSIDSHMNGNTASDPSARGAILVDSVLYRQWLRGELGNPDSAVATKYGMVLFDAQHRTWAEQARINADPKAASGIDSAKKAAFRDTASKVQTEDPSAYGHLKGTSGSRLGPAVLSLLAALLTAPFLLASDVLIVAALLIVRFAVIFFPALAVVGLHRRTSGVVRGTGMTVAAALVNSVVFALGAGIDVLGISVLLGPGVHLGFWAVGLCGLLTVALWFALKPYRRLTSMAGKHSPFSGAVGGVEREAHKRKSLVRRAAETYVISSIGGRVAGKKAGREVAEEMEHENTERAESYTQPPVPAPTVVPEADGGTTYRHALPSAEPPPRVALPAAPTAPYTPPPPRGAYPVPPEMQIYPAGAPLPSKPFRADATVSADGRTIWKTWNPNTQTYHTVRAGDTNA